MLYRLSIAAGVALVALAVAAPALAVRVHVRVEGARATIFGATEPRLTPVRGTITPPSGSAFTVEAPTPLGALEAASRRGEFFYRVESFSFGPYVAQVGRLPGTATTGWVFKVNGESPPVGAHAVELEEGDRVLWYHATFGPTGGPRTLHLRKAVKLSDPPSTCYTAIARNDAGVEAGVVATFFLDGRRVRRAAQLCWQRPPHWHTLRATAPATVRSQVVLAPGRRGAGGSGALAGRLR